jgi:hypothetical protein
MVDMLAVFCLFAAFRVLVAAHSNIFASFGALPIAQLCGALIVTIASW